MLGCYLHIWFDSSSDIAITVSLPSGLIISSITPDGPPAFSCFILIASVTIFSVTIIAEPSTAAELFREFLFQGNSTYKSLWYYTCQGCDFASSLLFRFPLSSWTHFSPVTSLLVSLISGAILKILFRSLFVFMSRKYSDWACCLSSDAARLAAFLLIYFLASS